MLSCTDEILGGIDEMVHVVDEMSGGIDEMLRGIIWIRNTTSLTAAVSRIL